MPHLKVNLETSDPLLGHLVRGKGQTARSDLAFLPFHSSLAIRSRKNFGGTGLSALLGPPPCSWNLPGAPPFLSGRRLPFLPAVRRAQAEAEGRSGVRRALLQGVGGRSVRDAARGRPSVPAPPPGHQPAPRFPPGGDVSRETFSTCRESVSRGPGRQEAAKRIEAGAVGDAAEVRARGGRSTRAASRGRRRPRGRPWEGAGPAARPLDDAERPRATDLRRGSQDRSEAEFHAGRSSASAPRDMVRPQSRSSWRSRVGQLHLLRPRAPTLASRVPPACLPGAYLHVCGAAPTEELRAAGAPCTAPPGGGAAHVQPSGLLPAFVPSSTSPFLRFPRPLMCPSL